MKNKKHVIHEQKRKVLIESQNYKIVIKNDQILNG